VAIGILVILGMGQMAGGPRRPAQWMIDIVATACLVTIIILLARHYI
jgi:hypothetical protein